MQIPLDPPFPKGEVPEAQCSDKSCATARIEPMHPPFGKGGQGGFALVPLTKKFHRQITS